MRYFLTLLCAALALLQTPAQAQRLQSQAELDALLAPVALHQDGLLWQILEAATHPEEVGEAAEWVRANPGLSGEAAMSAVQGMRWHANVKALVAFPELLARMAESPLWLRDLGDAFLMQQAEVMDTVQALRSRAHAAGYLRSDESRIVEQYGDTYIVHPPRPQVVVARYYDPLVVYGPWWWPSYRPVFWSPWAAHAVVVGPGFAHRHPQRLHRHVRTVPRHAPLAQPPAALLSGRHTPNTYFRGSTEAFRHVPESQRQPIVQSTPVRRPIADERLAPFRAAPAPGSGKRGFKMPGFAR